MMAQRQEKDLLSLSRRNTDVLSAGYEKRIRPGKRLFDPGGRDRNYRPYAIAKDGQRFLVPIPTAAPPLVVVLNWQGRLRT
jgi:hypothetical protein